MFWIITPEFDPALSLGIVIAPAALAPSLARVRDY